VTVTRRTVLLSVLAACGGTQRAHVDATPFDAGPATDYPPFSAIRFPGHGVVVARDDRGVMAVSAICTHQACLLQLETDHLECRCHGSAFAIDGELLRGPAKDPLPHFAVRVEAGRVWVDPSKIVDAATRTALPA
jgi:nitrite reductase/ring-hydroxylating ferredoxin subunit